MAPARTAVPSYTLTPRRWAAESRPFRVEPPPLVLDTYLASCLARAWRLDDPAVMAVMAMVEYLCL